MTTDDSRDFRSPSPPRQDDSIASHHQICRALFMKCHKSLQTAENSVRGEKQSMPLESQVDRYCIWFKNIAAHQDARLPSSLEYRIREDENAIRIVKKALIYLAESLEMLLMILTGEKENETWDSTSELAELSLSIDEGITSLFELSMIIRKKPEKDEYVKAALANSYDPTPDIVHVGDKYPFARSRDAWLMERLGTAITRRRQYLRYRKDHQEKMEQIHEVKKDADGKTVWSGEKASTYIHGDILGKSTPKTPMSSNLSSTGLGKRPQTEYADSSKGKDGALDLLRTPLLPKDVKGVRVKYGEYFECPYCWRPQNVRDKNEWKKHVFSDLRPYVCTFEGCGLNMFDSQNQWFGHELRFHRELWLCKFCKDHPPKSRPDLETHFGNMHKDSFPGTEMEPLLDSCAINRIDATCCPLCTTYGSRLQTINQSTKCDVSLKQFQEHLGRHMEQLALAALPAEDPDERETNEDDTTSDEMGIDGSVESDMARYWIPQTTPEGKLFYYNTMTGESSTEPPPDKSFDHSSIPPAFHDRAASLDYNHEEKKTRLSPGIPEHMKPALEQQQDYTYYNERLKADALGTDLPTSKVATSSKPVEKIPRSGFIRSLFGLSNHVNKEEVVVARPRNRQQRRRRDTLEVPAPYQSPIRSSTQTPGFDNNRTESVTTTSSITINTPGGITQKRETRERNNFEQDFTHQESISPPHSLVVDDSQNPGIARRLSRKVVPGLPRPSTFKRQQSELRDRLEPVIPNPEERRTVSVDRRRKISGDVIAREEAPSVIPLDPKWDSHDEYAGQNMQATRQKVVPAEADDFLPNIRGPREIMRERATRYRDVKIDQESMEVDRELRRIVQQRKNLEQSSPRNLPSSKLSTTNFFKEGIDRKEVSLRERLRELDERRLAPVSDADFISRKNREVEGTILEDSMNKIPRKSAASKFSGKTWSSRDPSAAAMDPEELHPKSTPVYGYGGDNGEGHRNQEPRESYNKSPEIETERPSRQKRPRQNDRQISEEELNFEEETSPIRQGPERGLEDYSQGPQRVDPGKVTSPDGSLSRSSSELRDLEDRNSPIRNATSNPFAPLSPSLRRQYSDVSVSSGYRGW